MVSPSESSDPSPDNSSAVNPTLSTSSENTLRNVRAPSGDNTPEQRVADACHHLLARMTSAGVAVKIPEEASTEFLDLRKELGDLLKLESHPEGLDVLDKIASNHITKFSSLVSAAALLNRLYSLHPTQEDCWRIECLVDPTAPNREDRENFLRDLGRLAYQFLNGRPQTLPREQFITLLDRGMTILKESSLTPEQRNAYTEVAGALAVQQAHFRGIHSLHEAIKHAPPSIAPLALAGILTAGIKVGHVPKLLAASTNATIALIESDPRAVEILASAVEYQASQGASVIRLLDGFARLYQSYPQSTRARHLEHYHDLIEQVRPLRAPIDLISRDIVDQFATSEPEQYAWELARHVANLEEIADTARLSGKLHREQILILRDLGAVGPNPELLKTLKLCVVSLRERCHEPALMVRNLDRLANEFQISQERWGELAEILSQQTPKNRPLDGIIQQAVEILSRDRDPRIPYSYWKCYQTALTSLEEEIPDLSFVTTDVVDSLIRDGSRENFCSIRDAIVCADELLTHIPVSERSPSRAIRELLQPDSVGPALAQAIALHHDLGTSSSSLFSSFLDLQRSLSPAGLKVLNQVVKHHVDQRIPLGHTFQNFVELERSCAKDSAQGSQGCTWDVTSELVEKLISKGTPLQFFGAAYVSAYASDRVGEDNLARLNDHLTALHTLSMDPRGGFIDRGWQELLSAIATLGPRSPGCAALTALLTTPEKGIEVLTPIDLVKLAKPPQSISTHAWGAILRSVDSYRERGESLERLCSLTFELDRNLISLEASPEELWKTARELMFDLREAKLPYDLITADFITSFHQSNEAIQGLLTHFLRGVTRFHERLIDKDSPIVTGSAQSLTTSLQKILTDITSNNYGLTDNPAMVHKLNLILAEGNVESLHELHYVLRELKMHALTDIMRNSSSPERRDWARNLMAREFNMGGPPYVQGSPEAIRHFNDSMQVIDRAFRDSKGFGGFALDSRGIPRSRKLEAVPPMLVRFGLDVAAKTCILNSSSNQSFPGKGLYIGGIESMKVFTTDPSWRARGKSSPHWRWVEGDGFFASSYFHNFDMHNFERAEFLNMRGLMCVIPPRESAFTLDGTHYCYLVYNRHFYPGTHTALGVPSMVMMELLGNSLIDAADFIGFQSSRTDLSKVDFSYHALLSACERRKMNLLDLTYGSVVGGGLCNAYLPKSLPHYKWERDAGAASGWTDTWGHIHKSFREGSYSSSMQQSLDKALQKARDLHRNVFDVFRPMQDYLSAFRLALSFYKMGQVLISDEDRQDMPDQQGRDNNQAQHESEEQDRDIFETAGQEDSSRSVHEYQYRMLEEVYRWYRGAKENGWLPEQMPVLYFAWVLDPNSLPPHSQRRFEIDLATMTIKTHDGNFQLPKNGTGLGDAERELWREHILPHFGRDSFGWEPRFLLRDGAFTIHE